MTNSESIYRSSTTSSLRSTRCCKQNFAEHLVDGRENFNEKIERGKATEATTMGGIETNDVT